MASHQEIVADLVVRHLAACGGPQTVSLLGGDDCEVFLEALLLKLESTKTAMITVHCNSSEHAAATLFAVNTYLANPLETPSAGRVDGTSHTLKGGHVLIMVVANGTDDAFGIQQTHAGHPAVAAAVVVVARGSFDRSTPPELRTPMLRRLYAQLVPGGLCLAFLHLKVALPYLDHLLTAAAASSSAAGEDSAAATAVSSSASSSFDSNSDTSMARKMAKIEIPQNRQETIVLATTGSDLDSEFNFLQRCWQAGFHHAEVVLKSHPSGAALVAMLKGPLPEVPQPTLHGSSGGGNGGTGQKKGKSTRQKPVAPPLGPSAALQLFDLNPSYLSDGTLGPTFTVTELRRLQERRVAYFQELLPQFQGGKYEAAAAAYAALPSSVFSPPAKYLDADGAVVTVGSKSVLLRQQEQQRKQQLAGSGDASSTTDAALTSESYGNTHIAEDAPPMDAVHNLLGLLRPWKKGPLNIFGVDIDTEWRSDWKWDRIHPHIGVSLKDKAILDVGCANGYFMFRMLAEQPKLVVGIDPNLKAWLEFQALKAFAGPAAANLHFEVLDGGELHFPGCFDVVFCLGVLYHVTDPMAMLRTLWKSMAKGATLIVDCQGIPEDPTDPLYSASNGGGASTSAEASNTSDGSCGGSGSAVGGSGGGDGLSSSSGDATTTSSSESLPLCLVPKGKYAGGGGMWFLPNQKGLVHWLERANYRDITVFYSAPLSTDEQRATPDWAHLRSLQENLDPSNPNRTVEGYPAPWRHYIRATRG